MPTIAISAVTRAKRRRGRERKYLNAKKISYGNP
jgi:hypothetical protein